MKRVVFGVLAGVLAVRAWVVSSAAASETTPSEDEVVAVINDLIADTVGEVDADQFTMMAPMMTVDSWLVRCHDGRRGSRAISRRRLRRFETRTP